MGIGNAHEEYNGIRHRKVKPGRSDAREDQDSGGVLGVVELPNNFVTLFERYLAVDGVAGNAV